MKSEYKRENLIITEFDCEDVITSSAFGPTLPTIPITPTTPFNPSNPTSPSGTTNPTTPTTKPDDKDNAYIGFGDDDDTPGLFLP